jgi:hypothetical protein
MLDKSKCEKGVDYMWDGFRPVTFTAGLLTKTRQAEESGRQFDIEQASG